MVHVCETGVEEDTIVDRKRYLGTPTLGPTILMNQDAEITEKSTQGVLNGHEDARTIVRLLQCGICSKPFLTPVTLPCGNTLCRQCLPQPHERENITWPDLPSRRQAVVCPFQQCGKEHPVSDCSVDVILAKMMDAIAEAIGRHSSVVDLSQTQSKPEVGQVAEEVAEQSMAEKPPANDVGSRLIYLYMLAAQGRLGLDETPMYHDEGYASDEERALDATVYQDLNDGAQREVDCQVCYSIILDPITTFCGHTLCRKCMTRVLDHSMHCPVCRRGMALPPSILRHPSNGTLGKIIDHFWPVEITARKEAEAAEDTGVAGDLNVPLFVCTLGFPDQPTFLRVFEPRYRLMLRRCLEGNQQFGMLMYNRYNEPQGDLGPVHFYYIGTMLRIVNAQLLPDGTSIIETRGSYRFRVTAHGTLDGYAIGSVEPLEDVSLAEEERIESEEITVPPTEGNNDVAGQIDRMPTRDLLRLGQDFVARMRARSANWLQQRVLDIHGQPPEDASLFPYWFAAVLPISDEEKYKLLDTRTVRERLKITVSWIRRIESQRW